MLNRHSQLSIAHSHSWRLILEDGALASVAASPIIDRENQFKPLTAMTPGYRYQCSECREIITIDDPAGIMPEVQS